MCTCVSYCISVYVLCVFVYPLSKNSKIFFVLKRQFLHPWEREHPVENAQLCQEAGGPGAERGQRCRKENPRGDLRPERSDLSRAL